MAKNPFEIFPPELWVKIFDKVEDPQDWLNLYRASPYFEDIVGENRSIVLFPKVFPHVFTYLWNGSLKKVLSLRLVSRAWNELVDAEVETLALLSYPEENKPRGDAYEMGLSETISAFLLKFDAHHQSRNPFIGRAVTLIKNAEFKNLARQLMERFGVHLRALRILDFTTSESSLDNVAHRLVNVIQLTPGLESLSFECYYVAYPLEYTDNEGHQVVPFTIPDGGVPIIHNLKSLHFLPEAAGEGAGAVAFFANLQNMIIRLCCNPHSLTNLTCHGVPPALLHCPNLQKAHLSINDEADCSSLISASWPLLHQLELFSKSIPFLKLVQLAAHFKDTLTTLIIRDLGDDRSGDASLTFTVVELPPRLTYFKSSRMVSFDSFLNLHNLEAIRFHRYNIGGGDEAAAAFCEGLEQQMRRTRIWRLLPKLKTIGVEGSGSSLGFSYLSKGENESQLTFRKKNKGCVIL